MATLLEMAVDLVSSHAATTKMTKEELIAEVSEVHQTLKQIEAGAEAGAVEAAAAEEEPLVSKRKAFGKDKIICMICGKEMKTLARHLKTEHDMTAKEYREKFGIPSSQALAARSYSESRRQMAYDRDLGSNLAKARKAQVSTAKKPAAKPAAKRRPASKRK